jgi:hypothetical protein
LKTKARPLVEAIYGFESGHNRTRIAANRALAASLKDGYCFTYEEWNSDPAQRKGLYKAQIIQKVVNTMWFANKRDEGVVFSEWFNPITPVTLALVLTAVSAHHMSDPLLNLVRLNAVLTSGPPASRLTLNSRARVFSCF